MFNQITKKYTSAGWLKNHTRFKFWEGKNGKDADILLHQLQIPTAMTLNSFLLYQYLDFHYYEYKITKIESNYYRSNYYNRATL